MEFPAGEQYKLIKLHVLLPLLLHVFERDRKAIEVAELKTKAPYIAMMNRLIIQVESDLATNKKALHANRIYIFEEMKSQGGIELRYKYKGRVDRRNFTSSLSQNRT